LSPETGPVEGALFLDVAHHLGDGDLKRVLETVRDMLPEQGRLTMRATVVTSEGSPWGRRFESLRLWFSGKTPVFRTEGEIASIVSAAGFKIEVIEPTASGREETWFIGLREGCGGQEP
jgi:cyclopropane fatty-acyl-phospholipid synthase-like methyltransferase